MLDLLWTIAAIGVGVSVVATAFILILIIGGTRK